MTIGLMEFRRATEEEAMCFDPHPPAKPLVFQGILTEDDVVAIWRCVYRLQGIGPLHWMAFGLAVCVTVMVPVAVALTLLTGLGITWHEPAAVAVAVLLWAFVFLRRDSVVTWLARRHYRRHATRYHKSEVTLGVDRVAVVNEECRWEFRWTVVGQVVATPDGLLFCNVARRTLFWLPNRVLQDDRRSDALALAEANRVRVRRVEWAPDRSARGSSKLPGASPEL